MDVGLSLIYSPWIKLDEQLALAKQADDRGYASVWVAETWGQDATAVLGALTQQTRRVKLGAAILQIPARQPTAAASAISTIDQLSDGRAILGLGLSGPQVSEGWYGVPFVSPLGRTKEYVETIRMALAGEPVVYEGKHWRLPNREQGMGLGKPIRMIGRPVQPTIPIYLGVMGEKTVKQAGRIADGWLPAFYSPQHADLLNKPLLAGLEQAGRHRSDITIAPNVPVAIADTVEEARDQLRPILTFYFGAMGAKDKNFYIELAHRYGFGDSAEKCQELFLAGDKLGAAASLSEDLIDLAAIAATPNTIGPRMREFAEAGADTLIILPFGNRQRLVDIVAKHLG